MTTPVRFCLAVHLHQPVGNFDSVFRDHLDAVYTPLLDGLERGDAWPISLHLSGPLMEWLEANSSNWIDRLGKLATDGKVELLAAGYDEPILIALDRADRVEQVQRHRDKLASRFGVDAKGLWLTERVWEPDLPRDLATAGIEFVLVDDRHLEVTGMAPTSCHRPWLTEHDGSRMTVLAIDKELRYLIPFRPVEELDVYFNALNVRGERLAVLGDDGEKFGGWPGTAKWVWEDGWFDSFTDRLATMRASGLIELSRLDSALDAIPASGPVYLPSATYIEMERWALPADLARELERREATELEGDPKAELTPLLRGGHWRHFLVKYPESNRLHKVMQWLSREARRLGNDPDVRLHIGHAQCNDAYWHGVFGGLYLPFLREALWRELASAARLLQQGQPLTAIRADIDCDGHEEVLVRSARWFVVIAPHRGGAIEVMLDLEQRFNWADSVTRHDEAYHPGNDELGDTEVQATNDGGGTASIHDLEKRLTEVPPHDREPRALFVDRFVADDASREQFIAGEPPVIRSFATERFEASIDRVEGGIAVRCIGAGITKTLRFDEAGAVTIEWEWHADDADGWFSTELSLARVPEIVSDAEQRWEYPIETVSRSEAGFDHTVQGAALVLLWRAGRGSGRVEMVNDRR